ncbi:MAG: hypothetical protein IKO52_13350 [Clostridia bacterium]|nr:hypothetical protein [Clostridia bacterium]
MGFKEIWSWLPLKWPMILPDALAGHEEQGRFIGETEEICFSACLSIRRLNNCGFVVYFAGKMP